MKKPNRNTLKNKLRDGPELAGSNFNDFRPTDENLDTTANFSFLASDRYVLFGLLSRCMAWGRAAVLSDALIAQFNTLAGAVGAPERELRKLPDMGPDAISLLQSIRAASLKILSVEASKAQIMSDSTSIVMFLRSYLAREIVEKFFCMYLNKRNHLLSMKELASGGMSFVSVSPREIVREALDIGASAIILVHNHPSGSPIPSTADWQCTEQIREACATFDIIIADHLIVARNGVFSMKHERTIFRPEL